MSVPVSSPQIQTMPVQPIGAYSLNGSKDFRAGHFVVNPPPIARYSFYDEIYVDPNFYKQLLNPKSKAFYTKSTAAPQNETTKKNKLLGALKAAVFLGGAFLAFKYRSNIKTFVINTFNKIKNLLKK